MKALVQRVRHARVTVGGDCVGHIGGGLCAFIGVGHEDSFEDADLLAERLVHLRIFEDDAGKMNRSLADVGGSLLVVSQFTLMADTRRGRRPSFVAAAPPEQAEPMVERVAHKARLLGVEVACGRFREHMLVELCNDGPVTLLLDTKEKRSG
ncbi:MAG: D-tyrosyl-tRNA(Tyr) deacylase [Candidatus Dadabacteria bacterium]|nr:MAG: D-tyrosyl-tRNA(Tyr) deacylase [Candidatus Dadabacteria bacterium]